MNRLVLSLALLGATPPLATAQVGRTFVSAEAFASVGRIIHVGKISRIEEVKEIKFEKPLTRVQKIGKPHLLVFEISETIRGEKLKKVELTLALQSSHYLEYLREQSVEIMLVGGPNRLCSYPRPRIGLLEQGKQVESQYYHFRVLDPVKVPQDDKRAAAIAEQINSYYDSARMFTNELKVVAGRDAILQRVRTHAKQHPHREQALRLNVPNGFARLCGLPNAFSDITLPIGPTTKKTLLILEKDPSSVLKHATHYREFHREQFPKGVKKALATFERSETE